MKNFTEYSEFKPTWLYIKQHTVTGLKYLGKTTVSESYLLEKYNGSGTYWKNHLQKHGTDVKTLWYELFTNREDCEEFALFLSDEFDIVNSDDWANLAIENGLDGVMAGTTPWNKGIFGVITATPETCKKISESLTGIIRGPQTESHKAKHSMAMKGKLFGPQTPEHIANKTKAKTGIKHKSHKKHGPQEKVTCPHCNTVGSKSIMMRWHFNNCKNKEVL